MIRSFNGAGDDLETPQGLLIRNTVDILDDPYLIYFSVFIYLNNNNNNSNDTVGWRI